jgi:hypothetical protein
MKQTNQKEKVKYLKDVQAGTLQPTQKPVFVFLSRKKINGKDVYTNLSGEVVDYEEATAGRYIPFIFSVPDRDEQES